MVWTVSEDRHFSEVLNGIFVDKFDYFFHIVVLKKVGAHLL